MKRWQWRFKIVAAVIPLALAGCATGIGGAASDVALSGAGGVLGYKISGDRVGGAAIGAAAGYVGSKIAQAAYRHSTDSVIQAEHDRTLNQAVKQQYWIIQNQQRTMRPAGAKDPNLAPVVIPEGRVDGAIIESHIEYLDVGP